MFRSKWAARILAVLIVATSGFVLLRWAAAPQDEPSWSRVQDPMHDVVEMPRLNTVTETGAIVSASADRAVLQGDRVVYSTPSLSWDAGVAFNAHAGEGRMDITGRWVELSDQVTVRSDSGLSLTTDFLRAQITEDRVDAPGPVQLRSPLGHINAGSMQITRASQPDKMQIHFRNGVRLIYTPQAKME